VSIGSHRPVEFVYFDLGNVLLSFDPAAACENLARLFSVSVARARKAVYDSGLQDRFEHGEVSAERFAELVGGELGWADAAPSTADILDAASDMFTPIDSMRAVLPAVRAQGFGVGLLSNTCQAHWDWIQRQQYGVMDFRFDAEILSFHIGSMKPEPVIYEAAERAAGVAVAGILFLDDKHANVRAALERGWQAVCCRGGHESIAALRGCRVLEQSP
jgi:HAD superfamily hydrolase (TIGR01509 family)